MILVAGLAVAGLAGIAAAFYFSLRSGNHGYRRGSRRPARAGSSRVDGHHEGGGGAPAEDWAANDLPAADDPWAANDHLAMNDHRGADNSGPENAGRARNSGRAVNTGHAKNTGRPAAYASGNYRNEDRTGPNTVMDFDQEPGLLGEPTIMLSSPTPLDAFGPAAVKPEDAEAAEQKAGKSRRRMGWRKGSDIDEEMWPAEAFGGMSDDQFWDDLASDKPLTTTARSAHQDPGSHQAHGIPGAPGAPGAKDRPGTKDQLPDASAAAAGRARVSGRRAAHGAGNAPGHPDARPRTAPQPLPQVPQVPSATPPTATQLQPTAAYPQPTAAQLQPTAAYPQPTATQLQPTTQLLQQAGRPGGPGGSARQFPTGTSQPTRSTTGPNETRGRRHAGASEDPLTSSAFSLRASGPVDGWSNQAPSGSRETSRETSREVGWDQYNAAVSQGTPTQGMHTQETPTGPPPSGSQAQAQRSSGGWPREGGADPYTGNSAYLYPGRPAGEQRSYGEDQPYRSRRGPANGSAPTQLPNALPYDAPYGDTATTETRRPNGAETRRSTQPQPPWPGYQRPTLPGEDHRRPRDPREWVPSVRDPARDPR